MTIKQWRAFRVAIDQWGEKIAELEKEWQDNLKRSDRIPRIVMAVAVLVLVVILFLWVN